MPHGGFRSSARPTPARRGRGFTILEILIATAILTLGLVGILAVFPVAINSGRKVMERSTAVTIAKSVAEAIRAGIRNQKRIIQTAEEPCTYFLFSHDGVQNPIPRDRFKESPDADYYILLPQYSQNQRTKGFDGPTDEARREKAIASCSEFVYPEVDEPKNGRGNPLQAHNDGRDAPDGKGIIVKKVYDVGTLLPPRDDEPDRPGTSAMARMPEERILEDQKDEPFKQYSYAFSIRASKFDTNIAPSTATQIFCPGNNLYHVRIMVFRRFFYNPDKVREEGKGIDPVYELEFEVAK